MKNTMSVLINTFIKITLILFLVFFCDLAIIAQETETSIGEEFDDFLEQQKSPISDSLKYYSDLRETTRLKFEIAKEKYFENQYSQYFTDNLNHRKQTFNWQLFSTKIIFFTVIIIVMSGLVFSGIQFYQALKQVNSFSKLVNSENLEKAEHLKGLDKTEIELSISNGIKINSSIIGLIILSISIAFFYLYILYVYPINQINIDNTNFSQTEIIEKHTAPNTVQNDK
jgi:hypothetical protein